MTFCTHEVEVLFSFDQPVAVMRLDPFTLYVTSNRITTTTKRQIDLWLFRHRKWGDVPKTEVPQEYIDGCLTFTAPEGSHDGE